MKQLTGTELKRLHRQWRKHEPPRLALMLEGLGGPFNLGSILRTAAAYRVEHLYLAGMQIDPTSTNVGKTALGADRYVPWTVHEDFAAAAGVVREAGHSLVGLELADRAVPMHEASFDGPVCLVIGHEDRGLSKNALAECDQVVFLPQLGRIGSLNVATATSIAIYEARRAAWG
ncbi:MAG: TrmH family RNA methyltransferase [Actinomycetota bacterium]